MEILDLLNKIGHREERPKKIKWRDKIWEYDDKDQDYRNEDGRFLFNNFNKIRSFEFLHDTVEIISEDIKQLNPKTAYFKDGTELIYKLMYDKINELVYRVNMLEDAIEKFQEFKKGD